MVRYVRGTTGKKGMFPSPTVISLAFEALVNISKFYADAIKGYQGAWVPSVVMGGSNQAAGSGAQQLIDMLTAKTAKELGIDMSVVGVAKTKQK